VRITAEQRRALLRERAATYARRLST
jgi:hypothetical protein